MHYHVTYLNLSTIKSLLNLNVQYIRPWNYLDHVMAVLLTSAKAFYARKA